MTTAELPAGAARRAGQVRARARSSWIHMRARGRNWIARARQRVLHPAVPGFAGAGLVSAAAGGIANYCWHGIGVWVGLGVTGLFCLRIDGRMS